MHAFTLGDARDLGGKILGPVVDAMIDADLAQTLLRLTDALASDLADSGIQVFAISPGMVRTRLVDEIEAKLREADPDFAGVPDAAFQPIEAGAALVVEIATGRADRLSGRYIHVSENLDAMLERSEEIVRDDLYVLRMKS